MLTEEQIARINELAKKKKEQGLNADEIIEQANLRKLFLEDFRGRFKAQLDNIELVDPDDPRLKNQNKRSS